MTTSFGQLRDMLLPDLFLSMYIWEHYSQGILALINSLYGENVLVRDSIALLRTLCVIVTSSLDTINEFLISSSSIVQRERKRIDFLILTFPFGICVPVFVRIFYLIMAAEAHDDDLLHIPWNGRWKVGGKLSESQITIPLPSPRFDGHQVRRNFSMKYELWKPLDVALVVVVVVCGRHTTRELP